MTPTGALTIIAGSGSSGAPVAGPALHSPLDAPTVVAVDQYKNVYVSDYNNDRVEKISPSGVLSVVGGTGVFGAVVPGPATSSPLSGPYGLAVDSTGNVWVSLFNGYQVVKLKAPRVAPGAPTLLSATRTSSSVVTAKFKVTSPGTHPIDQYQMACMNSGGSWRYGTSTTSTVKVSGLHSGTATCKARAHSAVGYGPYGSTFKR